MRNAGRVFAVLVVLVCTILLSSQTPPAEPEVARARVQDPGGIGPGVAVPRLIKFGGAFLDQAGKPMTGVHGLTVAVYKEQQGGAPLWLESQNAEFDAQGRYSILLGATKSGGVPLELFTSEEPRWLGVQMQLPGWEEAPRVLLVSVPYALKAAEAETLGGLPLSAFVLTPEAAKKAGREGGALGLTAATTLPFAAVAGTGTANQLPKWLDGAGTLGDSTVTDTGSAVGVGTTSPNAPFHVKVSATTDPVLKVEGANLTDGISLKVTHPTAVIGFALAGGTGHFFSTAVQHDAIVFGHGGRNLLFGLGGSEYMRVAGSGNVGIGTTTPAQKLDVTGNINASGNLTLGGSISAAGTFGFSGVGAFTAAPTGTGVGQGPLFVNPATAGTGETLLGLAVGGTEKFRVDSGGSVTTSGTVNLPDTLSATIGVLNFGAAPFLHASGGTTNTFLGRWAGNFYTFLGSGNTGIGASALHANLSGGNNTAIGRQALENNDSGNGNTATGVGTLGANSIGSSNTATGTGALGSNQSGANNTAVGTFGLYFNTTGNNNSGLGHMAGFTTVFGNANTTGSNNTFIGFNSGPGVASASNLQNATAIGANAVVSASNSLVLGSISGVNGATSGVNVGIGTATPAATLDVVGNVNTSGNIALPDTASAGAIGVITLGGSRFLHGFGATSNSFVGRNAGNFTMTGTFNTAAGTAALASNTTGSNNTATGNNALSGNSSGGNNTATGFQALLTNSTGSNNTATGQYGLHSNTGGSHNTATGTLALYSNTTGNENIAVGPSAGYTTEPANANTTGSFNTFIGSQSGPGVASASSLQNATAIGARAVVSANDSLVLGSISGVNGATASVNVGIGTATPGKPLDVVGDIRTSTCIIASSGTIGGVCSSDRRLKKDIQAFPEVLDKLVELRPVSFHWRDELPEYHLGSGRAAGLIAQEVEQVFPEMVSTDSRGYKQVNYSELPYLMLQAIRELKAENDKLRKELNAKDEQWEQRLRRLESAAAIR